MQTLIFMITFIPANFFVIHLLARKGLKVTMISAAALSAIGALLRLLVVATGTF